MTQEQLLDKCWELSFVASMNQRYYESVENSIATLYLCNWIFSTVLVCAVFLLLDRQITFQRYLAAKICIMALCLLIAFSAGAISESTRRITRLRGDWTNLRADVEQLNISALTLNGQPAPDWLLDRLQLLQVRRVRVMAFEPTTDTSLLDRCYREECRARGVASETDRSLPRPEVKADRATK